MGPNVYVIEVFSTLKKVGKKIITIQYLCFLFIKKRENDYDKHFCLALLRGNKKNKFTYKEGS